MCIIHSLVEPLTQAIKLDYSYPLFKYTAHIYR